MRLRLGGMASRRGMATRRRALIAVAALSTTCVVLPQMALVAHAEDDRDTVANRQQESADHVDQLTNDLNGIDSTLAQVYLDLDDLQTKIPVAQTELDSARESYNSATRQHEVALDQLESAQGEQTRLQSEVDQVQANQREASDALAGLAREMYRGDGSSPVLLAMGASGTEEISDRAAAAEALARTQNRVLEDAKNAEVVQRNQVERQDAVTARISNLEAKAQTTQDEAEQAKTTAQEKVTELSQLQSEAQDKKAEWESKKSEASAQLDEWQNEYQSASQQLGEIDAANRAQGRVYVSGDGMFTSPLPVALQMTSPFGWRMHPVLGIMKYHNGTDLAAACGTPEYPIAPGVVAAVTVETAGGNVVYVNHGMINGNSWVSAYVHMQKVDVSVGQQVDRTTVLGEAGATGYATGCHLHLSLMKDGADVDPMDYL